MHDLSFTPNTTRARFLSNRMYKDLADSLESVIQQVSAQSSELAKKLTPIHTVIDNARSEFRISPGAFTAYYHLIDLINTDEDISSAVTLLEHHGRQIITQLEFIDLSIDDLTYQDSIDLYLSALDTDSHLKFAFLPPPPNEKEKTKQSILSALKLAKQTTPGLEGEFQALVCQVILAAASKEEGAARFDGASSYMLWGALALSVDSVKSDLEMMETIAHESAHSFLFSLTIDEPLVLNDEDELFSSPLRYDARPMDGIYHATFVSARMHYAMLEALHSGALKKEQLNECKKFLHRSEKAFYDGYSVVGTKGILSNTGKTVMANALNYMNTHRYSLQQ